MKNKKLLVLLTVAVVLGGVVAFGAFSSEDSGGAVRRALFRTPAVSAPSSSNASIAPGANTLLPTPALTIQSHGSTDLVSDVRLEALSDNCTESFYSHVGNWKLNTNMAIQARGFKLWSYFKDEMADFKVNVGTSPDGSDIASYEVNNGAQAYFNAMKPNNGTFTIPAGQDVYVTLLGKYKASYNRNEVRTWSVAMKDRGVFGDFVGPLGSNTAIDGTYVQNNETNFTVGYTELSPYDGLTCNKFE